VHPNLLSLEVARPSKSIKHDFDFDHAPINKYMHPISSMLKVVWGQD
jgi:hypothetical protein